MDHYEVIEKTLSHIETHLSEPLSLDSMASTFHMSKYYFHRLFSAVMGCTLNQYILTRRLNASVKFIQSDHMSLTEISYQLNFGTPSSFSRAFKNHYGISPNALRKNKQALTCTNVPPIIKRSLKNINGDIVTHFTLTEFEPIRLSGFALEVDLLADDFKEKIRSVFNQLFERLDDTVKGSCYVIYSNCAPNSSKFKVLVGIQQHVTTELPNYFTVDIPQLFSAEFTYFGDLLDIGDVFATDFARFLKISRQEMEESDIELIQVFEDMHNLDMGYHIVVPIKKLPIDSAE